MDTTVTVDHIPDTPAETTRAREILTRFADAFEIPAPEIRAWIDPARAHGEIQLATYAHPYQIDGIHTLARILSRLFVHEVRVEEEGDHDNHWGQASTYQHGRLISTGTKQWVEHPITEYPTHPSRSSRDPHATHCLHRHRARPGTHRLHA